jgi:electron transfer flavoprotein alpha subunit
LTSTILIYVEHDHGEPKRTALELATKAAELTDQTGGSVAAVVLGPGANGAGDQLGKYGVDDVFVNDSDVFENYLTEPHADILAQIVEANPASALLFPDTTDGRDLASRLAARLNSGAVSAVIDLVPHDGRVDASETIFGGNFTTQVEVRNSNVAIFLVRPNAFKAEERAKQATTHQIDYTPGPNVLRAKKGEKTQEEGAPTPLEEASIIVSGGRGLGGPDPFSLLTELAQELGAVVGASRAAVDAGWIPYSHQVGQTGRTVKPQLYIAIGISGAVQHRAGMQTAETIIAINRDADAPIFQLADLGVVGDLFKIVPALTAELKRRKGA